MPKLVKPELPRRSLPQDTNVDTVWPFCQENQTSQVINLCAFLKNIDSCYINSKFKRENE